MPVTGNSASIIQSREENKWRVGFSDSQCHQGRSHRVSTAGPQWPIRRQQPSDSRAVSASPASALPIASDVDVWQPGTAPPPQGWSFSSRLLHLSRCLSLLGGREEHLSLYCLRSAFWNFISVACGISPLFSSLSLSLPLSLLLSHPVFFLCGCFGGNFH